MSRLADFFTTVGVKLSPLPDNTYVTGNIQGLGYNYSSANQISVGAGICYDSLNTTVLTASTSQVVSVPTAINTIYNLFLCDDGVVRTDTDVEGATLLAGTVSKLRWIGFVRNNSTGNICLFSTNDDGMKFGIPLENSLGTVTTTYAHKDHTILIPVTRVSHVLYGPVGTSGTNITSSMDGTTLDQFIGLESTNNAAYGGFGHYLTAMLPLNLDRYFKTSSGTATLGISAVTLKR